MKISILVENSAGGRFAAEHGLSYYIQYNDFKLLFDTGYSDIFLQNAQKLGTNLDKVENVVLSHGHWDHGDGLIHLKNKKLICHPHAFIKRFKKSDHTEVGLNRDWEYYNNHFKLISTRLPYNLTDDIIFLGEIPRLNDFEAQSTTFVDAKDNDDFILDDSALVFKQNDSIAIITGCSHSGICNIIEYAKKITGIEKVELVMGGFHLKEQDNQLLKTIEYFKDNKIKRIFPSHCTQLPALTAFYQEFGILQLKAGMIVDY